MLSYRVLHVRKMAISSLRSLRYFLLSGDEIAALKCFSDLDKCSIVQSDVVDLANPLPASHAYMVVITTITVVICFLLKLRDNIM